MRDLNGGGVSEAATPTPDSGLYENVDALKRGLADHERRRWRDFLFGVRRQPIAAYRHTIEPPRPGKIGICCSGGGIRSAAFNLGALQTLQRRGKLCEATYLTAVSGGSYIAAAYAMVAKRWSGRERPADDPNDPSNGHDDSNPALFDGDGREPFAPGSPEEQYLRNRSSYLAPGIMDKLYLASRTVVGVVFNFAFISLPLFGSGMLLGTLLYPHFFATHTGQCTSHCSVALRTGYWVSPIAVLVAGALLGLIVLLVRSSSDAVAQALQTWSTRLILISVVVAWLLVALPELVHALNVHNPTGSKTATSTAVGGGGVAALIAGIVAQLTEMTRNPGKTLQEVVAEGKRFAKLSSFLRRLIAYVVAAVVGPALLLAVMVLGADVSLAHSQSGAVNWGMVELGIVALAVFAALYVIVDLTSWSLHPFYKRRLCTAFALKRVRPSDLESTEDGHLQRDIACDELDGIARERDYDRAVPLSETAVTGLAWPTLIVCAAANISDPGATPPGRQVTSFTFSPYAVGGPLIGGMRTKHFEKSFSDGAQLRQRDLTLPAAVAMSGAALSPSMGKMTRRPLTFLMALGNIRLGVWVPNPRWVRRKQERFDLLNRPARIDTFYGRARPSYLLRELIGRNRVDARYLYVTDGGHYENLGLVELLRRGCTEVYCFDASGGGGFRELGDAVALARSELGVEITIDPAPVTPSGDDRFARSSAVSGRFRYRDGTPGTLIYARNVMTADDPLDIKAHHADDPRFPDDPTVDQLYTDQKFEAYRALGSLAGERAMELGSTPSDLPADAPQPLPATAPPVPSAAVPVVAVATVPAMAVATVPPVTVASVPPVPVATVSGMPSSQPPLPVVAVLTAALTVLWRARPRPRR